MVLLPPKWLDLTHVIEMTSFLRDGVDTWSMEAQVGTMERFTSLTLAWLYMLAGKAVFTIESNASGQRFTYRIERKGKDEFWFISVLTGPDNTRDYTYLGCLAGPKQVYRPDRQKRIGNDAPSRKAFEWLMRRIDKDLPIEGLCTIWHEGRCGRCGRALTTPDSIRTGLGPVCKAKALS